MNTSLLEFVITAQVMTLYAILSALPWIVAVARGALRAEDARGLRDVSDIGRVIESRSDHRERSLFAKREFWTILGLVDLAGVALFTYRFYNYQSPEKLAEDGVLFGIFLHANLIVDLFVLAFWGLLAVWPKGGAVALAAFRESIRQPMYWVVALLAFALLLFSMVMPYFTFGEDYKMFKQMGFDIIMFATLLFGLLSASISIHEEIEGRTAITVMSKPISRRQFLIGKYVGILLACAALTLGLGAILTKTLQIQPQFNKLDEVSDSMAIAGKQAVGPTIEAAGFSREGKSLMRGVGSWFGETVAHHFGLLLTFGQVMVLLAISAALATRMQFALNIIICVLVFLLGHLAPVLVEVTNNLGGDGASPLKLVGFIAQLFNVVFPALDYFQIGPAIIRDNPIPFVSFVYYVLSVLGYAILYSALAILAGLLLFEDRDLA